MIDAPADIFDLDAARGADAAHGVKHDTSRVKGGGLPDR